MLILTDFTAEFFACRTQPTGEWPIFLRINMQPLDPQVHYRITFRYDRDLYGGDKTYLNVTPSLNSATRAKRSGI